MKTILLHHSFLVAIFVCIGLSSCSTPSAPKPYGYYRIALPTHEYTLINQSTVHHTPLTFLINKAACMTPADSVNPNYFNIEYPTINATIHCSYLPIHNNLPALLKDAQEMVYSHAVKATAIPEQEYTDPEHHVHGVLYELKGNTATPIQFFLTDSARHFFRAAVYINTIPNQDSLAPVVDFLRTDAQTMVESFQWNR